MKEKILFLTDNLFLKRDYRKFGFKYLKNYFQIEIINVSQITNPAFVPLIKKNKSIYKDVKFFKNFKDFKEYLLKNKFHYSYDFLGIDFSSWRIRKLLNKKKIKILKVFNDDETVFYEKKKKLLNKILDNLKNNRFNIQMNKNFVWDYGIFHNSHAFNLINKKKCKKYIKTNTFDFDTFLENKYKKNLNYKNYFVFIDNSISDHPDYNYHGVTLDINEKNYLKDLKLFFDKFEKLYNSKIIIAANPKKFYKNKKIFGNRIIKYDLTSLLIKNAKGVLLHNSKAINFAVLYKKPVFFLTTNEINKTWFGNYTNIVSNFFNQKIININSFKLRDIKK